jgi:predicted aminopeptidase
MSAPARARARVAAGAALVLACAGLAGCASLGYLAQAVDGHLALMAARRPVEAVIDDPTTTADEQTRLAEARDIRDFAVEALALPEGGSYRTYVSLDRPYVVWNVVAAPEFSVTARTWCFPVAGCVAYRGYFDESAARDHAARLAAEGLDVHVGGARAYSTLGWFDDPILSSMLSERPYELAGVIFHELAHERVYVAGDSEFNEAYAVAVEREGVRRWLGARGRDAMRAEYEGFLARRARFTRAALEARVGLERLYASGGEPTALRAAKASVIDELRETLRALAEDWGRPGALASWIDGDINNARLALVATYHARVPAFERLLAQAAGDMAAFHAEVERIAGLPAAERALALGEGEAR